MRGKICAAPGLYLRLSCALCCLSDGWAVKAALMGLDETDFSIVASVEVWDVGAVYVMLSASGSVFSGSVVSCFLFIFSLKISGRSAYGCSPFTKPMGNARPCFHHVPCALWLVLFFEMGVYLGLTSSTQHWAICRPFAQFPVITREKIIHCSGQTHDTLPTVFIAVLGQQGFPVHLCCQQKV